MTVIGLVALVCFAILVTVVYAFGVRGIALLYPAGDPRRAELIAERYKVPRNERLFWIFEQFETAWMDGRDARAEARANDAANARQDRDRVATKAEEATSPPAVGARLAFEQVVDNLVAGKLEIAGQPQGAGGSYARAVRVIRDQDVDVDLVVRFADEDYVVEAKRWLAQNPTVKFGTGNG